MTIVIYKFTVTIIITCAVCFVSCLTSIITSTVTQSTTSLAPRDTCFPSRPCSVEPPPALAVPTLSILGGKILRLPRQRKLKTRRQKWFLRCHGSTISPAMLVVLFYVLIIDSSPPCVGPGHPLSPLSIHSLLFALFFTFPFIQWL